MSMTNEALREDAKRAALELFSDTSVSRDVCRDNLEELKADIEGYLDCLDEDDSREIE